MIAFDADLCIVESKITSKRNQIISKTNKTCIFQNFRAIKEVSS